MRSRRSELVAAAIALAGLSVTGTVRAAPPAAPAESSDVSKAREEFVKGAALAKSAQWAEALSAFERSAKLRRHAVTTFNIGACQRAMGNYTLARQTLTRALAENDASNGAELPEMLVTDARGYLAEIGRVLATIDVTVAPTDTRVAVDGRPLAADDVPGSTAFVAGIKSPGPGDQLPSSKVRVIVSPGTRVFTLSRKGFADAVVTRTFAPGTTTDLKLELDRLPATIHIASTPASAIVTLDGRDVGATPVDVTRPAGSYRVLIEKPGFVAYDTRVVARPGEEANVSPTLPKEKIALTQRWWFWTGAAVLVAGAAVGTYAYVRSQEPAPQPTPPSGGSMGWTVQLR